MTCSSSVPLLSPPTEAELMLRSPRELPASDDPPFLRRAGSGGESDRLENNNNNNNNKTNDNYNKSKSNNNNNNKKINYNNKNTIINNNNMKNINREGSTSQKIIMDAIRAVEGSAVYHISHQNQTTTKIKVAGMKKFNFVPLGVFQT
jgi:hypothetical protein